MAAPRNNKICTVCGEPFLPTGGRQKVCPVCKAEKKSRPPKPLEKIVKSAAELGISYGKHVAMSEEERNRAKEGKTMAEQEKHIEEVTAEPTQVQPEQDALQEYIGYLNQQEAELTARLEHIRIALEEAAAYNSVRHSEWRQRQDSKNPCTGCNR